jgi:hypothetical protein
MEHRRPSRMDKRIKLPQSNQPTPPGRHRLGGGHGALNKGEWDRRVGRLFEGPLAFACQEYTYWKHTADIRIRKPVGTLAFWKVVGVSLQLRRRHLRKPIRDRDSHRDASTALDLKPREVGRRGSSVITRCSEKVKLVTERGDLGHGSSLAVLRGHDIAHPVCGVGCAPLRQSGGMTGKCSPSNAPIAATRKTKRAGEN